MHFEKYATLVPTGRTGGRTGVATNCKQLEHMHLNAFWQFILDAV